MDIKISFIEKGSGFPLILLHGNGEEHGYFKHQIDYFSDFFRVIAIDTRGHGQSPRGEMPFTISQFADDLYEFIQEQKIIKAHILGFSDGGNIALKFTLKYPEFVEKLILNGANLDPSGVKKTAQIPIEIGYKIASFFAAKSENAKRNAEMLGLMVNDPFIDAESLAKIKCEALVIAGTKDLILERHSRLIANRIENSDLVFIKGDHFVAAKNPLAFNKAVKDFLDK